MAGFTPQQMIERVETAEAGDIVVSHAYAANTGQAIDEIRRAIEHKGLKGGTVSQVLGL